MNEQHQDDAARIAELWTSDPLGSLARFLDDLSKEEVDIDDFGRISMFYAQWSRSVVDAIAAAIAISAGHSPNYNQPQPSYNAQMTAIRFGMLHLAPWGIAATIVRNQPDPLLQAVRAALNVADRMQRSDSLLQSMPTFLDSAIQGRGKMMSGKIDVGWVAHEDGSFQATMDFVPDNNPHIRRMFQSWHPIIAEAQEALQPCARSEYKDGIIFRLYVHGDSDDVEKTIQTLQNMRFKMVASFSLLFSERAIGSLFRLLR